jgi:uncharacterized FlaG/YvyC family protein
MYLYSVKSTESVRGVEVSGAKSLPGQTRTQQKAADDTRQRDVKSERLAEVQTVLAESNISMKFSSNEQTSGIVVQLVDETTGETIIQIPNEVSLKLAAVNIKLSGLIVDETA